MITVRIVRHIVTPGDKYGRLTVIREVQKLAADGRRYRAALCRCDCGKEIAPRISSLYSGDARSCGCSRGQPKYQQKRCPVCGKLAMIRRDHRSCSRACGYQLAQAARQSANPSYAVWHHRVTSRAAAVLAAGRHHPGRPTGAPVTANPWGVCFCLAVVVEQLTEVGEIYIAIAVQIAVFIGGAFRRAVIRE